MKKLFVKVASCLCFLFWSTATFPANLGDLRDLNDIFVHMVYTMRNVDGLNIPNDIKPPKIVPVSAETLKQLLCEKMDKRIIELQEKLLESQGYTDPKGEAERLLKERVGDDEFATVYSMSEETIYVLNTIGGCKFRAFISGEFARHIIYKSDKKLETFEDFYEVGTLAINVAVEYYKNYCGATELEG